MNIRRTTLFFLLLAVPVFIIPAQTGGTTATKTTNANFFDLSGAPQWVRDLRRWEIVAFGTIPFAMFTATFGMDMYRWYDNNGMDFSDNGRKYAPWPLKSAGAINMDSKEMETTLIIAAGICITIAFADLIVTQIKRAAAKKRIETLPRNATTINRRPLYEDPPPEELAPEDPLPGSAAESSGAPAAVPQ